MAGGSNSENRGGRWWAGGATVVTVAGIAVGVTVLWVHIPALYASTPPEHGRATAIALTRIGVLITGVALLALAGVAANLLESRRATDLTHARELAEQLAGRYTAAITQLGSDTLYIRLGGIYALERIVVDSTADHRTVVEVLSAFVREQTTPGWPGAERRSKERSSSRPPGLDTDVQAALTVLGRLPFRFRVLIPGVDLAGARLAGADLSEANLIGAQLVGVDLSGAQLSGAQLGGANFTRAQMERANLARAFLLDANFSGAQLSKANLTHAVLAQARPVQRPASDTGTAGRRAGRQADGAAGGTDPTGPVARHLVPSLGWVTSEGRRPILTVGKIQQK